MGALIISLGLLVDDAMITIEMMISKIEEGMEKVKAATFAFTSTAFSMLTGTLVTIFGFLPIGLAANNTGQYCFSLFTVIAMALIASWFVAVIFAPVIGLSVLPSHMKAHKAEPSRFMSAFGRALEWGMRHRWLTIGASLVAFGASVYGLGFVQQQFFPASNRPELLVTMTLPKNASIAATEVQTERLEKVLASSPDISRFSSYVGGGAIRFYLPLDVQLDNDFLAETVIVAKDLEARDRVQTMLQQRLARDFPDVTARVSRLELGPPVGWPVQYRVSAPTTDEARHYAEEVMDVLRGSGLVRNVNYDWAEKSKELRIVVDQDRVRQAGLSSEQLANALNRVISGSTVTQVRDSIYLVDLVVRAKADERSSIEALTNLQITTPTGATVPLRELATFQYELDEGYVWRRGRLPTITVQAEPLPGVRAVAGEPAYYGCARDRARLNAGGHTARSRRHGREERPEQRRYPCPGAAHDRAHAHRAHGATREFPPAGARDQRRAARAHRRRCGPAHHRHAHGLYRHTRHHRARRHDHPQLGDPRRTRSSTSGRRVSILGRR